MRVLKDKTIIEESDLKKRVILIKNTDSEDEFRKYQLAALQSAKRVIVIKEDSFDSYNKFRVRKRLKPIDIENVLIVDVKQINKTKKNENII